MGLDLPQAQPKIAIIGRGIAGLALTYRLCKRGFRPVIYGEKNFVECASMAAQGVICNKGVLWPYQPLFKAKIKSLSWVKAWLQDIEKETACLINYDFSGVFEPYRNSAEFHKIHRRIYKGQFTGCFRNQHLTIASLPDEYSGLSGFAGTLFYPGDGWFDPKQLMNVLEAYCEQKGAVFLDARVESIKKLHAGIGVKARKLSQSSYDQVVLAAGRGSDGLLKDMGVSSFKFFHHPGQVLRIERPKTDRTWAMVRKAHSLVARDALYVGSTTGKLEFPDQSWHPTDRQNLWHILAHDFGISGLSDQDTTVEDLWGIRLRTADRLPLIGPLAEIDQYWTGVYLMTGFYKNGLQLADMAASWLEQYLNNEPIDPLGREFSPSRNQNA